jgi:thiol-disulfide isomerase/thioredoxin
VKSNFKLISIVLLVAFFLAWSYWENVNVAQQDIAPADQLANNKAPDFTVMDLDGSEVSSQDILNADEAIFLHFWASWCAPCVVEMPDIVSLAQHYQGKVRFILVSLDKETGDIEQFKKRLTRRMEKQGQDPGLLNIENVVWTHDAQRDLSFKTFYATKVPETIFISRQGIMIDKLIGETDWRAPLVDEIFNRLVK